MTKIQYFKKRLRQTALQIRSSFADALIAGLAAAIAWFISQHLLGHSHPIFSTISVLSCLAPGISNHRRQAIYVTVGVTTGVLIGELTLLLPPLPIEIRIALVSFCSLLLAASYTVAPAIILQTAISAIMVLAMGTEIAGTARLIDVMVGTGIGLLFSQLLFTSNQIKLLSLSVESLFHELADNFTLAARAIHKNDPKIARNALSSCSRTYTALAALIGRIDTVRDNVRWSLRGRLSSRELSILTTSYDQTGIRLYASTLLFCEALLHNIKEQRSLPPQWLESALLLCVANCRFIAKEEKKGYCFTRPDRSNRGDVAPNWRQCVHSLEMIENTLIRFYKNKTLRERLQSSRKKRILDALHAERLASKKLSAPKDKIAH